MAEKLTMLGLEANVDKPRAMAQNCRAGNKRVVNILEKADVQFEAPVIFAGDSGEGAPVH